MTLQHQYRLYGICAALILLTYIFLPLVAHAQGFVPLAETPSGSKLSQIYSSGDFAGFVNGLFKFAIAIGAILAVLRLAYAGYLYMGQSDMWSHKGQAKEIIKDVTIGLLLLLGIYLILYQINKDILSLNALRNIKPVQQTAPGQSSTQQFTTPPANNSFFGGTGGSYDSSINGCSGSGCGNQQDIINTGGNPGGY